MASNATAGGGTDTLQSVPTLYFTDKQYNEWIYNIYGNYSWTWLIGQVDGGYGDWNLPGAGQYGGYANGQGQSGSNGAGGAGGGYYGGFAGTEYWMSGTGGSSYASPECLGSDLQSGGNTGNGKIHIEFIGSIKATVNIDLGKIGTRYGQTRFSLEATLGSSITIDNVAINSGCRLDYFEDETTGQKYYGTTFTVDRQVLNLKAYGLAGLELYASDIGANRIRLHLRQDDGIPKRYKLFTYIDGVGWSNLRWESEIKNNQGTLVLNQQPTGSTQDWWVPQTAYYRIEAGSGAAGAGYDGRQSYAGGTNGMFTGYIQLNKGEHLVNTIGVNGTDGHSDGNAVYNGSVDYGGRHGWPYSGYGDVDRADGNQAEGGRGGYTKVVSDQRGTLINIDGGLQANTTAHIYDRRPGRLLEQNGQFFNTTFSTGGNRGYLRVYDLGSVYVENSNSYDVEANDLAAPSEPSGGFISHVTNHTMRLNWSDTPDNGTLYKYYAESYRVDTDTKLSISDTLNFFHKSGVVGYHWYIDSNWYGTVTKGHAYTGSNFVDIQTPSGASWLHVAAVDGAGNLGPTYNYNIPLKVTITYDKNDTTHNKYGYPCTSNATGNITGQEISAGGTCVIKGNTNSSSDIAFIKPGYKFTGWNTSSNGTGVAFSAGQTVEWKKLFEHFGQSITLYAQWEPISYEVRLYKNKPDQATHDILKLIGAWWKDCGDYISGEFQYDNSKTPWSRGTFSLHGWDIDTVWWTSGDGHGNVWGSTVPAESNNLSNQDGAIVKLYAKWNPYEYVIVYDGNQIKTNIYGDTVTSKTEGTTAPTPVKYDHNVTLAMNTFTKNGYVFDHWNTKPDNSGVSYNQGQLLEKPNFVDVNGGTYTLYAIWEPITYQIRFNSNDPDEQGVSFNEVDRYFQKIDGKDSIRFDQTFTLNPNQFKRENGTVTLPNGQSPNTVYTFRGWGLGDTQSRIDYVDKQYIVNFEGCNVANHVFDLYAIWSRPIELTFSMNGGQYQGDGSDVTLSGELWNKQLIYPFNITGGIKPASDGKWSQQTGTIDAYGKFDINGVNSKYTRVKDGITYRLIGFADTPNATEPISWISPYSDKTDNVMYEAYNSKTLYAVWEPVLEVNMELGRVLGNLSGNGKVTSVTAGIPNNGLEVHLRPGEQGYYRIMTPNKGMGGLVDFDTYFTIVYDNVGKWTDSLNPSTDEDMLPNQKHGLDRLIKLDGNDIRKFYVPNELGTLQGPPEVLNRTKYSMTFTLTQDSYFWDKVHNSKERIVINSLIEILKDSGNTGGSGGSGATDEEMDAIYRDLETHIKVD